MSERSAEMRAPMREATSFEEGGGGRFAIRAGHRLRTRHGIKASFARAADLGWSLHPDGFTFVASHRVRGLHGRGLA